MNAVLEQRPQRLPLVQACFALGLNRGTIYARQHRAANDEPAARRSRIKSIQPRGLSADERVNVIKVLHSKPYADQPPAEVYQRLLEQGQYLCSVSTMHRILRGLSENGDRRNQRPAQHHAVPRLLAQAPNEVWTWDITKCVPGAQGKHGCLNEPRVYLKYADELASAETSVSMPGCAGI